MRTAPGPSEAVPFAAGRPAHLLYNAVLLPLLVLGVPFWVPWLLATRKRRKNFRDRVRLPPRRVPPPSGTGRIWIHAVSVGESLSAVPLVRMLRSRRPEVELFFSTITLTGQEVAGRTLGSTVQGRFYFPFDLPWTCAAFLEEIRPDVVALLETEIWPNFIAACAARGIPVVVLNGRISERSFRGYARLRFLFGRVFRSVAAFSVQTAQDARRLVALGVDAGSVTVAGNMKFDAAAPADGPSAFRSWLLAAKEKGAAWIVAGSTHEGEDREVLRALKAARGCSPSVRLVLAPRHPERFEAVAALCGEEGLGVARRTRIGAPGEESCAPVVLLDTMGELTAAYGAADIAFVGGSLVPKGGHNILEPARFGVPVVVGPHMENFREIADIFAGGDALVRVESGAALAETLARWAVAPAPFAAAGRRGRELVDAFRGAAERNAELVLGRLAARNTRPGDRP